MTDRIKDQASTVAAPPPSPVFPSSTWDPSHSLPFRRLSSAVPAARHTTRETREAGRRVFAGAGNQGSWRTEKLTESEARNGFTHPLSRAYRRRRACRQARAQSRTSTSAARAPSRTPARAATILYEGTERRACDAMCDVQDRGGANVSAVTKSWTCGSQKVGAIRPRLAKRRWGDVPRSMGRGRRGRRRCGHGCDGRMTCRRRLTAMRCVVA